MAKSKSYKPKWDKWCTICGQKVDLRKKGAFKLSRNVTQYIPNKEYHYICSEACAKKMTRQAKR